jgi:hypothetical protein
MDQALSKRVAPLTGVELADNDVPRAKTRRWSFTGRPTDSLDRLTGIQMVLKWKHEDDD